MQRRVIDIIIAFDFTEPIPREEEFANGVKFTLTEGFAYLPSRFAFQGVTFWLQNAEVQGHEFIVLYSEELGRDENDYPQIIVQWPMQL